MTAGAEEAMIYGGSSPATARKSAGDLASASRAGKRVLANVTPYWDWHALGPGLNPRTPPPDA